MNPNLKFAIIISALVVMGLVHDTFLAPCVIIAARILFGTLSIAFVRLVGGFFGQCDADDCCRRDGMLLTIEVLIYGAICELMIVYICTGPVAFVAACWTAGLLAFDVLEIAGVLLVRRVRRLRGALA